MKWNRNVFRGRRFRGCDIEVYNDGILPAADNYGLARLVVPGVDLLMRHVRWDIDEVAGAGFRAEFKMIAPAHAGAALHDVEDGFKFAMMVRPGFGIGLHDDCTGPKPGGSSACVGDGGSARHARSLRRVVGVEFTSSYDFDSVILPDGGFGFHACDYGAVASG